MKPKPTHRRRAFLMLETIAAASMIVLLMTTLAWTLAEYSTHVENIRTRTRAVAAAESVLNEMRAGVRQDTAGFTERFKGLAMDVTRKPGEGDWSGMTLVVVKVRKADAGNGASPLAEMSGYLMEATP